MSLPISRKPRETEGEWDTLASGLLTWLTLRLLMSYIYIYIYIYICIYIYIYIKRIFLMFLDHTQRRTTVSRTPLDE